MGNDSDRYFSEQSRKVALLGLERAGKSALLAAAGKIIEEQRRQDGLYLRGLRLVIHVAG
jgi:hypothetical protein